MITEKSVKYLILNENSSSATNYTKSFDVLIQDKIDQQMYIVHRVVKNQLISLRQGNSHSKTRGEVRGGGKKPWKQKGTGKARAGSNRSPLWRGGGVVFGPRKKIYNNKVNKKEKLLAIRTIIHNKQEKTIIIPETWENLEKPSTKFILNKIKDVTKNSSKKHKNILIITEKNNYKLYLSTRNLSYVNVTNANNINLLLLIRADNILITLGAINIMKKTLLINNEIKQSKK